MSEWNQHSLWCYGSIRQTVEELAVESWLDNNDFYSRRGLSLLGLGVGTAAVLASTSLDEDFQRWHDEQVTSTSTDDLSSAVKWFGNGRVMVPIVVGSAIVGSVYGSDSPVLSLIGEWGNRCSRSLLVGGPPALALKYLLNGARPEDEIGSQWRPFDSPFSEGALSGHTFIGALPFLNAAMMTDDPMWKVVLYTASVLPAWSRVNDRMHYLSQVLLGWWLAWLSADVVDRTTALQESFIVVPELTGNGVRLQMLYRW